MFDEWSCFLGTLSTDSAGELDVLGHDGHTLGVDGTQVGILKDSNKVSLGCFLEGYECLRLETHSVIHVLGDLLQSVGVLISSLLIKFFGDSFKIADPICTLIFAVIVVMTTFTVLRDTLAILLEGCPQGIEEWKVAGLILMASAWQ